MTWFKRQFKDHESPNPTPEDKNVEKKLRSLTKYVQELHDTVQQHLSAEPDEIDALIEEYSKKKAKHN